jgi:hypothetical protein
VPAGSYLEPFEPVLRRLLQEWPHIKAPRMTEILHDEYGEAAVVGQRLCAGVLASAPLGGSGAKTRQSARAVSRNPRFAGVSCGWAAAITAANKPMVRHDRQEGTFLADEERRSAVAEALARLGQAEADLADPIQHMFAFGGGDHGGIVAQVWRDKESR